MIERKKIKSEKKYKNSFPSSLTYVVTRKMTRKSKKMLEDSIMT